MAEDKDQKTQKPTSRRLQKARQKGQIPRSREVVGISVFIATLMVIKYQGSNIFESLKVMMANVFSLKYGIEPITVLRIVGLDGIRILTPVFVAALVISTAASVAQGGFVTKPFSFKFDAFNPISGLKQKFTSRSFYEALKSLLKFITGSVVFYLVMKLLIPQTAFLMALGLNPMMMKTYDMMVLLIKVGVIWLLILAVISYVLERKSFTEGMMMSKEEIKEEHKESEGDPKIKQRIRTIQFQMARKRMLQAVPKATVIITNPTHFAVALLYDGRGMNAPQIVAKGADHLALRIREIAKEHKVPIIEDKPLARTLYTLAVDSYIPPELYKAVAKIIAMVYKLKGKAA